MCPFTANAERMRWNKPHLRESDDCRRVHAQMLADNLRVHERLQVEPIELGTTEAIRREWLTHWGGIHCLPKRRLAIHRIGSIASHCCHRMRRAWVPGTSTGTFLTGA